MTPAWRRALVAFVVLSVSLTAFADDRPGKTELGFVPFGLAVTSGDGDLTVVGVPAGSGFFGPLPRGLYLQRFVTAKLALEPQVSATGFFGDGENFRTVSLSFRANYLFRGADRPSLYAFGGGGLWHAGGDGDGDTNPTIGTGVGYRRPIRSAGSLRIEAGYEHMFEDSGGTDVFSLSFGVALRF
jgi:hypothetical protein